MSERTFSSATERSRHMARAARGRDERDEAEWRRRHAERASVRERATVEAEPVRVGAGRTSSSAAGAPAAGPSGRTPARSQRRASVRLEHHVARLESTHGWSQSSGGEAEPEPAAGSDDERALHLRLVRLRLASPIADRAEDRWLCGEMLVQPEARRNLEELRRDFRSRVMVASASGRLVTALNRWERFLGATQRDPFMDPSERFGQLYNQETLNLFTTFIAREGSLHPWDLGKPISSDSISGYVGSIRLLVERMHLMSITPPGGGLAIRQYLRDLRREAGPPGARSISRGIRGHQLAQLDARGYDRSSSTQAVFEWAAALLAHNCLLRGGELGTSKHHAGGFDPTRDLTWASFEWHPEGCAESEWRPYFLVDIVSCKDPQNRNGRIPTPVCRRNSSDVPFGADPLCAYDAVRAAWERCVSRVPEAERTYGRPSTTPFFRGRGGAVWTTHDTRRLAQDMAKALEDPQWEEYGGKAFRIAGATDLRAHLGLERASFILRQRGRWSSDVAFIYQRALLGEHLTASAAIAGDGSRSRTLEDTDLGYAQPATHR